MIGSLWQRWRQGVRRVRQQRDWPTLVGSDWADRIMEVVVTDDFHAKQGRSTGRWIIERAGKRLSVYLKRHYQLPWWQGVLATLFPGRNWSPALQEWEHLEWARTAGFPVPRAVAGCEYVGPRGRLQSCLAVEELVGMLPLHQAIPLAAQQFDPVAFRRWKDGLLAEMARLTHELHRRHRFHKDLYLCHFYIPRADTAALPTDSWRGRVHMIDLHRLGHHPGTWPVWQVKDLAQLLYSTDVAGVTDRDRLAFWKAYSSLGNSGWWAGLLRRLVVLKSGRYRNHNRKPGKRGKERRPSPPQAA